MNDLFNKLFVKFRKDELKLLNLVTVIIKNSKKTFFFNCLSCIGQIKKLVQL